MTLLTRHVEAGWREVEAAGKYIAEKSISLRGATASLLHEEADTFEKLVEKLDVRERLLGGDPADTTRVVITNDGSLVTDGQHEALRTDGVAVSEGVVSEPRPFDPQQQVEPEHPRAAELTPSDAPVDAGQSSETEQPVTPPAEPTVIAPGVTDTEPVPSTEELTASDVQTVDGGVVAQEGQADTESSKPAAPATDEPFQLGDANDSLPAPAEAPLTDEERAALAANEAELEAQRAATPAA